MSWGAAICLGSFISVHVVFAAYTATAFAAFVLLFVAGQDVQGCITVQGHARRAPAVHHRGRPDPHNRIQHDPRAAILGPEILVHVHAQVSHPATHFGYEALQGRSLPLAELPAGSCHLQRGHRGHPLQSLQLLGNHRRGHLQNLPCHRNQVCNREWQTLQIFSGQLQIAQSFRNHRDCTCRKSLVSRPTAVINPYYQKSAVLPKD